MQDAAEPSKIVRLSSVAFFLVLVIASFVWFVLGSIGLVSQLIDASPVIVFDKGAMYMLGISVGLCSLLMAGIYQGILGLTLSTKGESNLKKGIVAGLAIMFLIPQLVHYSINGYIANSNYYVCEEASYQWFLYKKIVYTGGEEICKNLSMEKNIPKRSGNR